MSLKCPWWPRDEGSDPTYCSTQAWQITVQLMVFTDTQHGYPLTTATVNLTVWVGTEIVIQIIRWKAIPVANIMKEPWPLWLAGRWMCRIHLYTNRYEYDTGVCDIYLHIPACIRWWCVLWRVCVCVCGTLKRPLCLVLPGNRSLVGHCYWKPLLGMADDSHVSTMAGCTVWLTLSAYVHWRGNIAFIAGTMCFCI